METFVAFAIPTAAFAVSAVAGFYAYRAKGWGLFGLIAAIWSAFTIWMVVALFLSTDWGGLLYLAGLIAISAPSAIGTGIGALTGLLKQKDTTVDALT